MALNQNDYVSDLLREFNKQKESYILESLNDLVSRGLLEVHQTQPVLVHDPMTTKIEMRQSIKLVLKDKEYIEKLEQENQDLKDRLFQINEAIGSFRK